VTPTGSEKTEQVLRRLADSLYRSEETRQPIGPLTEAYPPLTLEQAYRVQQINAERRIGLGQKLVGHKIGLTAQAMRDLFKVSEPDYGHLFDNMVHDHRKPLDLAGLIDPQIECEPAFVLSKRLKGPGVTGEQVLDATAYISTCFEVIDSRVADWRIKLQDTVADNGSSARVVMGPDRVRPRDLKLDCLDSFLEMDGEVKDRGNTSAILGHPANGVAWLANAISKFGLALETGHIVLPGTCTRSHRMAGFRTVRGMIEGIGEVSIRLHGAPTIRSI
jgi:2-oxopent-4-enoate hydratase